MHEKTEDKHEDNTPDFGRTLLLKTENNILFLYTISLGSFGSLFDTMKLIFNLSKCVFIDYWLYKEWGDLGSPIITVTKPRSIHKLQCPSKVRSFIVSVPNMCLSSVFSCFQHFKNKLKVKKKHNLLHNVSKFVFDSFKSYLHFNDPFLFCAALVLSD